ncbi:hypothetical protein JCGZ_24254 [Jatropha curcas]|uniref:Uncharacterized protein n=1 Tax=Jatropha curcas TaxID=180498 RepID=A0A067JNW5_JATCU|nr:hypothetical protein JCGZ_24254 [Jatropha curcas]
MHSHAMMFWGGVHTGIVIPADLRCRPRGTRRSASDSGLPDPTSAGFTPSGMSWSWRMGGCGGISPVSPVP